MDIQIFMCQVSSVTLGGAPSGAPGTLQDSSVLCGWVRGVFVCLCVLFCVLGVVAPSDLVAISLCSHHTPLHRQMSQPTTTAASSCAKIIRRVVPFVYHAERCGGTAVALTTPPSPALQTQLPRLPGNAIVLEEPDEVCADDHSHSRITHH